MAEIKNEGINDSKNVINSSRQNNQKQSYEKISYKEFVEKEDRKLEEAEKRLTSK